MTTCTLQVYGNQMNRASLSDSFQKKWGLFTPTIHKRLRCTWLLAPGVENIASVIPSVQTSYCWLCPLVTGNEALSVFNKFGIHAKHDRHLILDLVSLISIGSIERVNVTVTVFILIYLYVVSLKIKVEMNGLRWHSSFSKILKAVMFSSRNPIKRLLEKPCLVNSEFCKTAAVGLQSPSQTFAVPVCSHWPIRCQSRCVHTDRSVACSASDFDMKFLLLNVQWHYRNRTRYLNRAARTHR